MSLKDFFDKFEAKVNEVRDGRPDPVEEFLDQTGVAYAFTEFSDERMTLEEAIAYVNNSSELNRLREQLEQAEREADVLQQQLGAAGRDAGRNDELQRQLNTATRERDEAQRNRRQAQDRIAELERELEQANQNRQPAGQQQRRSRFGR